MRLENLLEGVEIVELIGSIECEINDFHFDSREIGNNDLFIAISGTSIDGSEFIDNAIDNGATAIICSDIPKHIEKNVSYIKSSNLRSVLSTISRNFYDKPSTKLKLIGVTGTNGKTSVVSLLHQLFSNLGHSCGLISTVENIIVDQKFTSTHTTPDPKQLNFLLSKMVNKGCSYCFMEVSSHAVDQQRIFGLHFDIAVFTNITHDHLDYHENFENYLNAKKLFFDDLESAINFAEKNNYKYEIQKPNKRNLIKKSYAENFTKK